MEDVVKQKLDDAILEELKVGSGTVKEITERLRARVRSRLDRLYEDEQITRVNSGGLTREYVFGLLPVRIDRRY
jgi:ubiquinone biosynthesis protein COQ9